MYEIFRQMSKENLLSRELFVQLEKLCFRRSDALIKKNTNEVRDLYSILLGKLSLFNPAEISDFFFKEAFNKKNPMCFMRAMRHIYLHVKSSLQKNRHLS